MSQEKSTKNSTAKKIPRKSRKVQGQKFYQYQDDNFQITNLSEKTNIYNYITTKGYLISKKLLKLKIFLSLLLFVDCGYHFQFPLNFYH